MKHKPSTWPLWACLPNRIVTKLLLYQKDNYGEWLDLVTGSGTTQDNSHIESLEEIDRLIRQKPRFSGNGWQGG